MKVNKTYRKLLLKQWMWIVPFLAAYGILLFFGVKNIYLGFFPFWYDPARDLLSAWDNLSKPTLIGPTSGVPGIFYGPYWIWLLSLGLIFTKDPRSAVLVVGLIPYFFVLLVIAYRFSKYFDWKAISVMVLLFLLNFREYYTALWNPYPAPFIAFCILLLLVIQKREIKNRYDVLTLLSTGFFTGLLINFHISFGIGFTLGVLLFTAIYTCIPHARLKSIISLVQKIISITLGIIISFSPFFLFEVRHGFQQSKTALSSLSSFGGNIILTGLSDMEIVMMFFERGGRLFSVSGVPGTIIGGILAVMALIAFFYHSKKLSFYDKKLGLAVATISFAILMIYLTANNPVWEYHFIGVEMLFVGLGIFLFNKVQKLNLFIMLILIVLVIRYGYMNVSSHEKAENVFGTLAATKATAQSIDTNAGNYENYGVYAYSRSLNSFEYAYTFRWMIHKNIPYLPEKTFESSKIIYFIIPPNTQKAIADDFINYRTPRESWITRESWIMPDRTAVIKREVLNINNSN